MSQKKTQLLNPLSGNINVAGVITASSFVGSGQGLTGVAATDNIQTATSAKFLSNVNVSGITTVVTLQVTGLTTVGVVTAATSIESDVFYGPLTGNVTGNATGLSGTPNITVGSVTAASGAFSGNAGAGGAIGTVISIGVRRGLFSNEAGSGTETMAHGAAKTNEPVREGLVAMLGPLIDTIIVCSITAFVILLSGVYNQELNGVSMTVVAFENELGVLGKILIMVAVITFSLSTMFGYSYYGRKCTSYIFGTRWKKFYNIFYVLMIIVASTISIDIAINFMDSAFALMVIPTMVGTLLLAPKVLIESEKYFEKL